MQTAFLAAAAILAGQTVANEVERNAVTAPQAEIVRTSAHTRKSSALDDLFRRLKAARNAEEASVIERVITRLWLKSGSPTVDLLMQRTGKALAVNDETLALDLLDAVVRLRPDFAEGWSKRASVLYSVKEYGRALADIRRALALEPRHFGSLAGLGLVMQEMGDAAQALAVFRKALKIHPFLDNVAPAVKRLEIEVEGRKI